MDQAQAQLKPGDELDRYRIIRLLAAGGMGEVYEAVHRFTKRPIALKCLQLLRREKSDFRDRMRAEAEVLSALDHPNIVKVFDADVTPGGMVWMAMELLLGRTLREVIHFEGAIAVPRALHFAAEIADGIGAAHEIPLFHRDLKPENVFITQKDEVKVLDFGAAKFHDRGVKTTERLRTIGTTYYMSPEQLLAQQVDRRTDIYSLGLVLYEMLAGRYAFSAPSTPDDIPSREQVIALQLHAMPAPIPVAPAVWRIVERAIAKDPAMRPATMADLARELRDVRRQLGAPPVDVGSSSTTQPVVANARLTPLATEVFPGPSPMPPVAVPVPAQAVAVAPPGAAPPRAAGDARPRRRKGASRVKVAALVAVGIVGTAVAGAAALALAPRFFPGPKATETAAASQAGPMEAVPPAPSPAPSAPPLAADPAPLSSSSPVASASGSPTTPPVVAAAAKPAAAAPHAQSPAPGPAPAPAPAGAQPPAPATTAASPPPAPASAKPAASTAAAKPPDDEELLFKPKPAPSGGN